MNGIAAYFEAERLESLFFLAFGLAAIGVAVACWALVRRPFYTGMAWPLLLVGAIQVVVGTTVWLRSPQDVARVQAMVQQAPHRLHSEEIPRMQAVMRNFVLYRWIEVALLAAGALLAWRAAAGTAWQGAGAGLVLQAGLMLALDLVAERRGQAYVQGLQALSG
jgi:hypothetical protein